MKEDEGAAAQPLPLSNSPKEMLCVSLKKKFKQFKKRLKMYVTNQPETALKLATSSLHLSCCAHSVWESHELVLKKYVVADEDDWRYTHCSDQAGRGIAWRSQNATDRLVSHIQKRQQQQQQ